MVFAHRVRGEKRMAKATINVPVSIDLSTIQRWMESSDIVEVVRCKDCIHAKEMTQYGCGECVRHCEKLKIVTTPDWFCAEGRLKA